MYVDSCYHNENNLPWSVRVMQVAGQKQCYPRLNLSKLVLDVNIPLACFRPAPPDLCGDPADAVPPAGNR